MIKILMKLYLFKTWKLFKLSYINNTSFYMLLSNHVLLGICDAISFFFFVIKIIQNFNNFLHISCRKFLKYFQINSFFPLFKSYIKSEKILCYSVLILSFLNIQLKFTLSLLSLATMFLLIFSFSFYQES